MNPNLGWFLLIVILSCTLVPAVALLVGTLREVFASDPIRGGR